MSIFGEDKFRQLLQSGIDAICFDVDSTVSPKEGIDDLAAFLNVGEEVAKVTKEAMDGLLDFRQALEKRLAIMKIRRQDIRDFLLKHPPTLNPNVEALVEALKASKIQVYLVSGGFRDLIEPLAHQLGLCPVKNVIANSFVFEDETAYARFDKNEPTSESGGKSRALQAIIDKSQGTINTVVMVGDGATDLEARPPAKFFIGYGFTAQRKTVIENSDWFIKDFQKIKDLIDEKHLEEA